ncbi:MAG: TlpA family protein disulfide reductase [Burkholderiales bacterium]|nr:Thiol-disulfide oxidoreductase ResA [Rhodocyclaceae bacterium]MCZ2173759.1 TlpA family protein disulfide reductase [Burkholderiales bacterium]HNQ56092.1 TlpA disulfide reductase family protein [Candidatus Desulfobacillus denitrificans]MCQ3923844.1 TlpA family protein disulfide reductase [Rhodocyclaceae bacterium]MCZ2419904.1 TlpA family protein disulfide reductase [Burkholderiales bacterium]
MRFLLLAGLALLAACGGEPPAKLNIGDAAPAFRAERLDGAAVDFPPAAGGKPMVIRFWADWCRYCEPEMKAIDAVYRRHRDRGLEVLAVNAGQDRKTVDAFIRKLGVGYPTLLDEQSAIAKRYGVVGLPTTYFVDGKGVVRGKVIGEADEAVFERHALELLK